VRLLAWTAALLPCLGCPSPTNGILDVTLILPVNETESDLFVRVVVADRDDKWDDIWAFPAGTLRAQPLSRSSRETLEMSVNATGDLDDLRLRVQFCGSTECASPTAEVWYELQRPFVRGQYLNVEIAIPSVPSCEGPVAGEACTDDVQCASLCAGCEDPCGVASEDFTDRCCLEGESCAAPDFCEDDCACLRGECTYGGCLAPPPEVDPMEPNQFPCVAVGALEGVAVWYCTVPRCRIGGCPPSGLAAGYCQLDDEDDDRPPVIGPDGVPVHLCDLR